MKKAIFIVLAGFLLLSISGCFGSDDFLDAMENLEEAESYQADMELVQVIDIPYHDKTVIEISSHMLYEKPSKLYYDMNMKEDQIGAVDVEILLDGDDVEVVSPDSMVEVEMKRQFRDFDISEVEATQELILEAKVDTEKVDNPRGYEGHDTYKVTFDMDEILEMEEFQELVGDEMEELERQGIDMEIGEIDPKITVDPQTEEVKVIDMDMEIIFDDGDSSISIEQEMYTEIYNYNEPLDFPEL